MKVVVIGTGFVAQAYLRCLHYLGFYPLVLSRSWLNYTDPWELEFCLKHYKPDMVINCAGYTGDTVDDCEQNKHDCYHANVTLPNNIAIICGRLAAPLIHISSGCIFNGAGPFTELDNPNFWKFTGDPFYVYCKGHAESMVMEACPRSWLFRIRMPFSHIQHKRNWLCKLMKYDKILDGLNSVTWIDEFAMRSWQLSQKSPPGIYHAAQLNPVRTLDVAKLLKPNVTEYDPAEFLKTHVQRSAAVLDCTKFEKAYGTQFTDTMTALRCCIEKLQLNTKPANSFLEAVPTSDERIISEGASAMIG
jgi:dTDP-4-dehydrorhamnose reductase